MAEIDETISGFIACWQGVTGHERANYQLYLTRADFGTRPSRPRAGGG